MSKQGLVGNVESYLQKVRSRYRELRAIDHGVQIRDFNVNFQKLYKLSPSPGAILNTSSVLPGHIIALLNSFNVQFAGRLRC